MRENGERTFNVIVLLYTDTKPDRDRLRGILRFMLKHREWNVLLLPGHPANRFTLGTKGWRPDGIITNEYILSHPPNGVEIWERIPNAVLTDSDMPSSKLTTTRQYFVDDDNPAIGRLAADFFLSRGFENLAYLPPLLPRRWSDEREVAFKDAARAHMANVSSYKPERTSANDWAHEDIRLSSWLKSLPKPCGLLCANDNQALQALRVCTCSGINIPEHISILGVDNDDFACEFARPALSSIQPEFESCGYRAAELLHTLMSGKRPSGRMIKYGNPCIVERDSTFDGTGMAHIVSHARTYIAKHATDDIDIADVAAAVGVSRRTLERRFAALGSATPAEELRTVRLAYAKKMLEDTTIPIGEIAQSCGFSSDIHLKIAFKKACGMTMREYRNSMQR